MLCSSERLSAETALLDKIEALSFLRLLNDRLAAAHDNGAACRALVEVVHEERAVAAAAYLSIDHASRSSRLEACAPGEDPIAGPASDATPPALVPLLEPAEVADAMALWDQPHPAWLRASPGADVPARGSLVTAPTRVRGTTTGALLVYSTGDAPSVEEDRRILGIAATSAALALEVARREARVEFVAMLRHDISNPVHAALGCMELLTDGLHGQADPRVLGYTAAVVESLKTVADLVTNYLVMEAIAFTVRLPGRSA